MDQDDEKQRDTICSEPRVKRTPVKDCLNELGVNQNELLKRPVKTINKCIQKHFEAWQNVGLADVMHDSKQIEKDRKKAGMATTNRLYSLHAEQMKKRDQKI